MDDLRDLNWSGTSSPQSSDAARNGGASYYAKPAAAPAIPNNGAAGLDSVMSRLNVSKPASGQSTGGKNGDPFASLFGSNTRSNTPQTLAARQEQLDRERSGFAASGAAPAGADSTAFSGIDMWEASRDSTQRSSLANSQTSTGLDEFSARSKPSNPIEQPGDSAERYRPRVQHAGGNPFESEPVSPRAATPARKAETDGADLLGGMQPAIQDESLDMYDNSVRVTSPESHQRPGTRHSMSKRPEMRRGSSHGSVSSQLDPRVEQVMELGFSEAYAKIALQQNNYDVEAAVELLLALQTPKQSQTGSGRLPPSSSSSVQAQPESTRRPHDRGEELAARAAELGTQVYTRASKLFSVGRARFEKAVDTYFQEPAPRETSAGPKWLAEAHRQQQGRTGRSDQADGASNGYRSPHRHGRGGNIPTASKAKTTSRPQTPVSVPDESVHVQDILDLGGSGPAERKPSPEYLSKPQASKPAAVPTTKRNIPSELDPMIGESAKNAIETARLQGGKSFKEGDYASASLSYGKALQASPPLHPVRVMLLTNLALCASHMGDSKTALQHADEALELIKRDNGNNTAISFNGNDKGVGDFWLKAMTRKAQALETMERYEEARTIWMEVMQKGESGKVAIEGKQRCDKALTPARKAVSKPASKPATRPAPGPRSKPLGPGEAAANLAKHEKANEFARSERERLYESVDQRVLAWKKGKEDNVRALIASMDAVLWENAQWTPVSMAALIQPNRVKIHYMKAVSKVHPDKIPQGASIETKMIAENVFSTLNKAWDVFKTQNGMP